MYPNEFRVITSQLGYRGRHGRKRVVATDVPAARGIFNDAIFNVIELNHFSMYGLNDPRQQKRILKGSMRKEDGDFGRWLVGDFSSIESDGVYQAYCGNELGPSFAIRDDVYMRIIPELIRYFQIQSCGRNVPGWHPVCHLDDARIEGQDRWIKAAGGWHDAGDFRKWVTSTSLNAIALLMAHRLWDGREGELGIAPGIFLAEARQGVEYFLGVQDESGALHHNIGGGDECVHDNLANRYTDNVPESGDERLVWPGWATPAGKCTTLFALYANAFKKCEPELAARCLAAARLSEKFDLSTDDGSADKLQWRTWACLELWRNSASDDDRRAALKCLDALLALQVKEFVDDQSQTRGFFRAGPGCSEFHHKHVGADYVIWVVAEFVSEFPDHPDAAKWKESISMWFEDYVKFFARRNPFGLLPYSLYSSVPGDHADHRYRRLGDGLFYRYFTAGQKFGSNARSSLSAAALAAAASVLNRPECLDYAYPLLEWTLGHNPFQLSTLNGVGVLQPCALSFQMGNIPGGVTMGIMGDAGDMPWYYNPWSCGDEYYGYQTSHFLWALAALQKLAWK